MEEWKYSIVIEIVLDIGEYGWAICKVGPLFRKYAKKNPVHVMTPRDRISLYSDYAKSVIDIPLWVHAFSPNCFHRNGFKNKHLEKLRQFCYDKFDTNDIVFHVPYKKYGKCQKKIPKSDMTFVKYKGNEWQRQLAEHALGNRKNIVIWPRRRMGGRVLSGRNWSEQNWRVYLQLLMKDKRLDDYNIVALGIKSMSALVGMGDHKNFHNYISFIDKDYTGFCITMLEDAVLAIGSQSAGPILSLHTGTPTIIFGHEQQRHKVEENPHKTRCDFIFCHIGEYDRLTPKKLYKHTIRMMGG